MLAAAALLAPAVIPASAQQPTAVELRGQVMEWESHDPVAGIVVTLRGRASVLTDADGRFRFRNVPTGRHVLTVQGIGYRPVERALELRADTSLVIEVDVAPVPLDPLGVVGRGVDVRGNVLDATSGIGLPYARVVATPELELRTTLVGRFRLRRVPSGFPLTVQVQSFGYLPSTVTIEPQQDTTLEFRMEPDPVVQRMIAVQMARIDERANGYRYRPLPVLEWHDLVPDRNAPGLRDLLRRQLGDAMARRVACLIIDESQIVTRWRAPTVSPLEIHRIEITEYPGMGRQLMVRVYTRDFVQELVTGRKELVPREQAMRRWAGQCR